MGVRHVAVTGLLILLTACGRSERLPPPDAPSADAAAALNELVEQYFEDYLALYPTLATDLGDHRYDDRLQITISDDHRDARRALQERNLAAALALDPADLDAADLLTLELFLYDRRVALAGLVFPDYLLPFDQFNSFPNDFAVLGSGAGNHPFETVADYDNFLARINDFERYAEVALRRFGEGVDRGVVHPRIVVERMLPQLIAQVVDDPQDSVFWQPVAEFPEAFTEADRRRLRADWERAISEQIAPAFLRLHEYLAGAYLAAARESVGWSALPDGDAWYDRQVAYHTSTAMTPEEIHDIGLAEVARLRAEMETVRQRVRFDGGDLADFFQHLKTADPFFWDSAQAMLADYRGMSGRVDEVLPSQFEIFPAADFEIRPIEAFRAASAPGAEYLASSPDGSRPGVFYLNTADLRRMPRWGMSTLFLHEALPGHHFQGAIARELDGIPRFRRFGGYTAYAEGWALYAEDLGVELGLLEDPYQYFGKLNDEMLRAMRLVVDTGLHRKGWSRERAIAYMQENSSLPEAEIVAEVERYIAWPGQALAYKTGQLAIRRLKDDARESLGPAFDVRSWHTMVLADGELPIEALQARQRRWLTER